jgi:hypothetical protein
MIDRLAFIVNCHGAAQGSTRSILCCSGPLSILPDPAVQVRRRESLARRATRIYDGPTLLNQPPCLIFSFIRTGTFTSSALFPEQ